MRCRPGIQSELREKSWTAAQRSCALFGDRSRGCFSLRRELLRRSHSGLHDHLDRVLDALARVSERPRQILESESVGVDLARIETFLRDQGGGAMGRTAAFAADAVDVNVVAHEMCHVDEHRLVRKRSKAQLP